MASVYKPLQKCVTVSTCILSKGGVSENYSLLKLMRDFFPGCGGTGLYLSVEEAEPGGFVSSQPPWTCTGNSRLDKARQ